MGYDDDAPPTGGNECFVDQECITGETCARDNLCWPVADVRFAKATWTMRGQPADETTCAAHPNLQIRFEGGVAEDLAFSPVPCKQAQFVVDKLPTPYTRVVLGLKNGPKNSATITSDGTAQIDLTF